MLNVIDLFAGPGGLSLGLEMVRDGNGKPVFKVIKAVERDQWACKTLRRNFNPKTVIEGDITDDNVKRKLVDECGESVDVVVGGPPCQSFSLIGPRSGNPCDKKDRYKYDALYVHFLDVVRMLKPKVVLFENVRGILSKKNGDAKVIDMVTDGLIDIGYNIEIEHIKEKYMVLNAAEYGVPQMRERVFIIANNIGIKNPFPKPTHINPSLNNLGSWTSAKLPYVTVFDAIGDLPRVMPKKTFTGVDDSERGDVEAYNEKVKHGKETLDYSDKWMEKHRKKISASGAGFYDFVRPSEDTPLYHHMARPQMVTDILLFKGMKQGTTAKDIMKSSVPKIKELRKYIRYDMNSFTDKYKKHHWKRPSSTIFAHLQKDGNRFIHPDSSQGRTYTPREAARIQSFPDSFFFEGPLTKKFQQIGNAVPPILAKTIGDAIFSELEACK